MCHLTSPFYSEAELCLVIMRPAQNCIRGALTLMNHERVQFPRLFIHGLSFGYISKTFYPPPPPKDVQNTVFVI